MFLIWEVLTTSSFSSPEFVIIEGTSLLRARETNTAWASLHKCNAILPTLAVLGPAYANALYPVATTAVVRAEAPQWFHPAAKRNAKQCFVLSLCSLPQSFWL